VIRVLVADDHAVVRRGLKELLTESHDVAQVGEASTGREVLDLVARSAWDAVVLDLNLPDQNGLDVLRRLREENPRLPVLILTICSEDQFAVRALRAGAAGYLTKESAPEELVGAVRKVVAGGRYVSGRLAERLALRVAGGSGEPPHEALSDREFQVFQMLASGRTVSQAAGTLNLSVKTISTYRARLLEKLTLRTNADLVLYAVRNNLIE
jgi:two-component system, NarL family, invasion response regulator UvrY